MANDKGRASEAALADLHSHVATELTKQIVEGVQEVTREGEVVTVSCKPATLAAAIKFLKDNGVDAPAKPVGPVADVAEAVRQHFTAMDADDADPPVVTH